MQELEIINSYVLLKQHRHSWSFKFSAWFQPSDSNFQRMFKVLGSLNIEGRSILPGTWGSMWQAPEIEDFFSEGPEWLKPFFSW